MKINGEKVDIATKKCPKIKKKKLTNKDKLTAMPSLNSGEFEGINESYSLIINFYDMSNIYMNLWQ